MRRGQVSIEYLLTVMFAVMLAIAVMIITFNMSQISNEGQLRIINSMNSVISSLMS